VAGFGTAGETMSSTLSVSSGEGGFGQLGGRLDAAGRVRTECRDTAAASAVTVANGWVGVQEVRSRTANSVPAMRRLAVVAASETLVTSATAIRPTARRS
jgi:hypothetical protein